MLGLYEHHISRKLWYTSQYCTIINTQSLATLQSQKGIREYYETDVSNSKRRNVIPKLGEQKQTHN